MLYTENRQNKLEIKDEFLEKVANICDFALKEEGVGCEYQISLLFVDNDEIREINRETRNIDKTTDVLSFPMLDYEEDKVFNEMYLNYDFNETFKDGDELVLGDMVLSLEKAMEQSKEYGHSYEREVGYLIIHSVLHLLGYDHIQENDKKRMRKREEEILGKLKIIR